MENFTIVDKLKVLDMVTDLQIRLKIKVRHFFLEVSKVFVQCISAKIHFHKIRIDEM